MATPIGAAASRPFKVRNSEEFFQDINGYDNIIAEEVTGDDGTPHVVVWADDGFWPEPDGSVKEEIQADFTEVISRHLPEGEYAIMHEVSYQGPTSIRGQTMVADWRGNLLAENMHETADRMIKELEMGHTIEDAGEALIASRMTQTDLDTNGQAVELGVASLSDAYNDVLEMVNTRAPGDDLILTESAPGFQHWESKSGDVEIVVRGVPNRDANAVPTE